MYEKNISDKFKWSDEELATFQQKTVKEQSSKWVDIIGKLEEKSFEVKTYFRYLFTAQKLIADNEAPIENKYEFVKIFNELNISASDKDLPWLKKAIIDWIKHNWFTHINIQQTCPSFKKW